MDRRAFDEHLDDLKALVSQAKAQGIRRPTYLEYARTQMAGWLAPLFDVSERVIDKRIQLSGAESDIP